MLLANPLPIKSLATLLQLDPVHILQALKGLQSILIIPEDDDNPIRPIHTSLRDFLTSWERSNDLFIQPEVRHFHIAIDCLQTLCIPNSHPFFETERSAQHYACRQWTFHLLASAKTEMLGDSLFSLLIDFASNNFNVLVNTILRLGVVHTDIIYNQIYALVSCILCFWHMRCFTSLL